MLCRATLSFLSCWATHKNSYNKQPKTRNCHSKVSPTQQCGDYNPCVLNWNECSQLGTLREGQTQIDSPWFWRVKLSRPDQKSAIQWTWIPTTPNRNCVTLQSCCNSFVYCLTPLRTWNHLVPSRDNTLLFSSLQMHDRPPIIANLHFHSCCFCMSCRNFCPACLATTHELCIKKTCPVLTSSIIPSIGLLWSSSTRPICSADIIQTLQQNRVSALQDATLTPAKPLGDV